MVGGVQFIASPRSIPMRATLITISTLAVLAASAGPAAARPDEPNARAEAASHAAAVRAQGLYDEQRAAVAASRELVPGPPVIRVTRVAQDGFDWADAGIGAGLAVTLLLSAGGVATLRRQHTPATR